MNEWNKVTHLSRTRIVQKGRCGGAQEAFRVGTTEEEIKEEEQSYTHTVYTQVDPVTLP